jgi:hypothetical protein
MLAPGVVRLLKIGCSFVGIRSYNHVGDDFAPVKIKTPPVEGGAKR